MNITKPQLAILKAAVASLLGVAEFDSGGSTIAIGFRRKQFEKMCQRLVDQGLLKPYVHGGYEITSDGRAVVIDADITGEDA